MSFKEYYDRSRPCMSLDWNQIVKEYTDSMQAVVPHVCAWIETVRASRSWLLPEVAPRVGAQFQRNRLRGAPEAVQRHFIYNFPMSCRERFQKAYGNGLERQYAAYQKLSRGVSSPVNFSHISLVSGLPFSSHPLTGFSTDITHPIRKDSCGRLNPKWLSAKFPLY